MMLQVPYWKSTYSIIGTAEGTLDKNEVEKQLFTVLVSLEHAITN